MKRWKWFFQLALFSFAMVYALNVSTQIPDNFYENKGEEMVIYQSEEDEAEEDYCDDDDAGC